MSHKGVLYSKSACLARVGKLLAQHDGRRVLLGIAGAPGSGKSRLAKQLRQTLARVATLVPMDGFHLPLARLDELGRRDRQGAPDTFDAPAFVELLRRLRGGAEVIKAPSFRRDVGEPLPDAITVPKEKPLVIVEGNYLLLDDFGFAPVAGLLDESWFVDTPEERRLAQLVGRHVRFGATPEAAKAWSYGPDQRNAELVARTRVRADYLVCVG
ncbi:nucleoside/nucleotide kinase family protein [Natronoglycomyces albus]|uniref:Nucleoside/nucleotide kinase family protein n=1 Tax=Natronoglycomyces albus TaxID=2811108 RepID=A0A895XJR4_9ACTN|nr:nucleoside/nucleotide kinase family protein [Natronoglycomyces albus]QSB04052.1 nucleoside/nucleotide kinase family protein [Natronoglycomyces albus]